MRFGVLLSVVAAVSGQAQEPSRYPPNQIRTTATATRAIPPDLAVIRFEFSARDSTPSGASRAAAAVGDLIRKAVAKTGIPEDSVLGRGSLSVPVDQALQTDIKMNSEFRRYDTAYVYKDLVEVRVHDLKRVAKVIDAALAAGAQKLALLQFSSTRVQEVGQEALGEATRQARRNAEIMAKESGGKLGRPLEVTTDRGDSGSPFYDVRGQNGQGTTGYMAPPPNGEVRVSVFGRWELLAGESAPGP
jgi:uncharacterized protein